MNIASNYIFFLVTSLLCQAFWGVVVVMGIRLYRGLLLDAIAEMRKTASALQNNTVSVGSIDVTIKSTSIDDEPADVG